MRDGLMRQLTQMSLKLSQGVSSNRPPQSPFQSPFQSPNNGGVQGTPDGPPRYAPRPPVAAAHTPTTLPLAGASLPSSASVGQNGEVAIAVTAAPAHGYGQQGSGVGTQPPPPPPPPYAEPLSGVQDLGSLVSTVASWFGWR